MVNVNKMCMWMSCSDTLNMLTCVQVPWVGCCRHGWDGEGWRSTVRFHQFPLVWDGHWTAGPERRFQRSNSVELDSGQATHKPRCVIFFYKHWIDVTGFCGRKRYRKGSKVRLRARESSSWCLKCQTAWNTR